MENGKAKLLICMVINTGFKGMLFRARSYYHRRRQQEKVQQGRSWLQKGIWLWSVYKNLYMRENVCKHKCKKKKSVKYFSTVTHEMNVYTLIFSIFLRKKNMNHFSVCLSWLVYTNISFNPQPKYLSLNYNMKDKNMILVLLSFSKMWGDVQEIMPHENCFARCRKSYECISRLRGVKQ